MSFALKLKELREKKGLSQAQLAKELNVGIGSVGMWESTQRTPPAKKLKNIAEYFGVTIDYFFVEDDEKLVRDYYKRNSMNIPQIAHRLRAVRLRSGLTQKELAAKLNSTDKSIWNYENGIATPPYEVLIAYTKFFDVSADYLLGLEDDFGARTATAPAVMGENYSSEERQLIEDYQKLNARSKKYLQDTIKMLLESVSGSEQKKKEN